MCLLHKCIIEKKTCWPQTWLEVDIAAKELVPLVIVAAMLEGTPHVVSCQHYGSSDSGTEPKFTGPLVPATSLPPFLLCSFSFTASLVPGIQNVAADAISCGNVSLLSSPRFPRQ